MHAIITSSSNLNLLFIFLLSSIGIIRAATTWGTLSSSLVKQACSGTANYNSCTSRLGIEFESAGALQETHGPFTVIHAAIKLTINEAIVATELVSKFTTMTTNFREQSAVHDCMELLDYSVHELGLSLVAMKKAHRLPGGVHRKGDLGAWLSAALGNQDTCMEGFQGTDGRLKHYIKGSLRQITILVTNVMAMYKRIGKIAPFDPQQQDRYGNESTNDLGRVKAIGDSPSWMTSEEHSLVHHAHHPNRMKVDATVAQDGSGKFRSIMEAINDAPKHSLRRYVIYVKKGLYKENVEMKKNKVNILLVGDGMGITIISGDRSFSQGWTTFRTATFAVSGRGFIARDITFRNTAGPNNHQAVALRVDSDHSVFYRCSIEGYQDSLYAHSLRQFYRDCNIYGTIDFIFGNGNVVIQHSKIIARKPLPYQMVTITAQGRKYPSQTTGFAIHNSFVYASTPTYLGRPWKQYSRTVFLQCYLTKHVQSRGWLEWAGDFALNTLYYGEYSNYGPGSNIKDRVRWKGYHAIHDAKTAATFSVRRFINGLTWIPFTGVTFTADLVK